MAFPLKCESMDTGWQKKQQCLCSYCIVLWENPSISKALKEAIRMGNSMYD